MKKEKIPTCMNIRHATTVFVWIRKCLGVARMNSILVFVAIGCLFSSGLLAKVETGDLGSLTPKSGPLPRINGPAVFGVRPGNPFVYRIPVTGQRPMTFSVKGLPDGLVLNDMTGVLTGTIKTAGEYPMVLSARNSLGNVEKTFRVIVGESIALTPPMGWNSWNCWGESVDAEKVRRAAKAMVESGLADHGWTYVNIDDGWQGRRSGRDNALEGNEKFPDMAKLCADVHAIGLRVGLYSTPWITSYATFPGGSSDNKEGDWSLKAPGKEGQNHVGKYHFEAADARQWAVWGVDFLKYDWQVIDVANTTAMATALRESGRDIVLSLSNAAPVDHAADWARLANCWRTTGDIRDYWERSNTDWSYGISELGFSQDSWATYAGPGHWNDPDMLVIGQVGWGPDLHKTNLSAGEQYSHISLWCMLSAPLLIGCDLERLDPFTIGLLSNDEVLALQYDSLGKQATRVATVGAMDIYRKELSDGGRALGFFNRGEESVTCTYSKLARLGISAKCRVRDLWRNESLPDLVNGEITVSVPAHGVILLKFTPTK